MSADSFGGSGSDRRSRPPATSGDGGSGQGYAGPPVQGAALPPELESEGLTLRDYVGVIWRRLWVIALVVIVATGAAYYSRAYKTRMYASTATVIYQQNLDLANPLTGEPTIDPVTLDRELASINSVLASPDMQSRAGALLKEKGEVTSADYTITAAPQTTTHGITSTTSNVVTVTSDSSDPQLAAAAANAYATAYVAWSLQGQKAQIAVAIGVIKHQLAGYTGSARLGGDYILLKQQQQDLQILQATSLGNYRVLAPATVSSTPYAPTPLRSAILGFAIGLFAGIGLAFLLEEIDPRVRKPDEIATLLREPILGRVPRIKRKTLRRGLPVTLSQPDGPVAEAFRMVRTNLDLMGVDDNVRSIAVTSCNKGEGKSVGIANLAVTMALAGKKVVLVDAALRRPRLHKFFQISNELGVSTVTAGRSTLADSLVPVDLEPGAGPDHGDYAAWAEGADSRSRLYVLPSGPLPPNPGELVVSRHFADIIRSLAREADLVLVDTPDMLSAGDTSAIAASVDGIVFLVDMHTIKKPQLLTAAEQLRRLPTRMLGILVRTEGRRSPSFYYTPGKRYYGYAYTDDGTKVMERRRSGGRRSTDRAAV
jgi:non-specific protein-tyrosine kinase